MDFKHMFFVFSAVIVEFISAKEYLRQKLPERCWLSFSTYNLISFSWILVHGQYTILIN